MCLKHLFIAAGLSTLMFAACQQHRSPSEREAPAAPKEEQPLLERKPAKLSDIRRARLRRAKILAAQQAEKQAEPMPAPRVEPVAKPFVPKAVGRRVARVDVPGPYVALTFDDGPNPSTTPKILDILRQHGAHATFFVAGENAVNNKKILARAAADGHEIGAHTYSHIRLTGSSDEKIDREMSRTNAIIEEATGRKPVIMRPPYGATNSRLVDKMYNDYGMKSILWDVDTQDWRHPGVDTVVRRAVGNARAGSIILVHDIHASTLAAVDDIVTGLQARGFKLVTVSQLLALASRPTPQPASPQPVSPEPIAEPDAANAPQPLTTETVPPASVEAAPQPAAPNENKDEVDQTPGSASISIQSNQD